MKIKKLKLSITDACEGTCAFCYRGPIHGRLHLAVEPIARSLRSVAADIGMIHISGGNPLLHHRFREILDLCLALKVPVKLSANPFLLLKKYSWVVPLISKFSFSLEAARPELHDRVRGIPGDFDALNALMMAGLGVKSTIIIVVTNENADQVPEMIDLAKRLRPQRMKVQLVEQSLVPRGESVATYLDPKLRAMLQRIYACYGDDPDVELIPRSETYGGSSLLIARYLAGRVGPEKGEPAHCGYMLNNPHIKEDGTVYPCCGVSQDREIGNIHHEPLAQILERHNREWRHHAALPYASCEQCIFFSHYNPLERLGNGVASVASRSPAGDVRVQ